MNTRNVELSFMVLLMLLFISFTNDCICDASENNSGSIMEIRTTVLSALNSEKESGQWPETVQSLSSLLTDDSETTQLGTCSAIFEFLDKNKKDVFIRQNLIQKLSQVLIDPNVSIRTFVSDFLITLNPIDFNESAKLTLEKSLELYPSKETILLAEKLQIPVEEKIVTDILQSGSGEPIDQVSRRSVRWAAEIVQARKGNPQNIKNILTRIEMEKNKSVQTGQFLRELEWIHQPEAVIFLKRFLDSDERLFPEKPNQLGPKVAQYAAVSLVRMLKGFPIKKTDYNFTDEELEICRNWMNHQTEWKFETNY